MGLKPELKEHDKERLRRYVYRRHGLRRELTTCEAEMKGFPA